MGNFNYYGVVGKNGVAVMDSWERVLRIEPYFRKITYRGFDTFDEAEAWCLNQFENRFPRESGKLLSLYVNQAVFVSKLRSGEM